MKQNNAGFVTTDFDLLLIEPLGIETEIFATQPMAEFFLLIEPLGIETFTVRSKNPTTLLLIEPLGIETNKKPLA